MKFEYDELVFISMNLKYGRISRGNAQLKMKRWHSGEELEPEMMINILDRNRDKDKGKALSSLSRIWSMSLGLGVGGQLH